MSTPTKGKPEGLLHLTMGEARLILLGVLLNDSTGKECYTPLIDFERLAVAAPYKNTSSASSSYRQARKKLFDLNSNISAASGTGTPPTTTENRIPSGTPSKKSPGTRKRTTAAVDSDATSANGNNTAEDEVLSPTSKLKRQRKSPTEEASVKMEAEGDETIYRRPIKFEPYQPALKAIVGHADEETLMNMSLKSEEEEIMTELDIDAEFAAMEGNRMVAKVLEAGNA
ncbi:hypothetical protein BDW59DRAFT_165332 [Aspergillus cavernicola]|uniref:Uncharacterized protein n=1 Tax=Aspergillus cavernicola TaxID=176166 RepID=A0ABR4HTJ0_9EURO